MAVLQGMVEWLALLRVLLTRFAMLPYETIETIRFLLFKSLLEWEQGIEGSNFLYDE